MQDEDTTPWQRGWGEAKINIWEIKNCCFAMHAI
jgi:hypothetical protein